MDARIALVKNFERIDATWLAAHPEVKVLAVPQTCPDNVDEVACEQAGVRVVTLQGERAFLDSITSTAEHTFGLILALARNYKAALCWGKRTEGHKLAGKTLGIVGIKGRIGQQMKRIAKGFGMKVIGTDKDGRGLLKLLKESDIVTVHISLAGNEGFWKLTHFKQMKRTAFFVNTSRTNIMEKGALLQALEEGLIAGASLDFVDDEELREYENSNDNLVLSPHIGGNTVEDRLLTDEFIINKAQKCLLN